MTEGSIEQGRTTLRSEQVAQTRRALVAAGRRLFGTRGFAETSVEALAAEARVTTGALYHHFPTKSALFEAVFELVHSDLMEASMRAASGTKDEVEILARGFEAFLDAVLDPEVRRIVITDAPAVMGLERFIELDERHAFAAIAGSLRAATAAGKISVDDPETMARLLLGALTRGAMLIAGSASAAKTRDDVGKAIRHLLGNLATGAAPAGRRVSRKRT